MIAPSLQAVRDRIEAAAGRAGRDPDEVVLVAVTKGRSIAQIRAAYDAGHRDFGENRAGEMAEKVPLLPPDIRWHFVGSLQSRKVRLVRETTFLLHSLDRPRLAAAWAGGMTAAPPVLIQVNVGGEPQKHGVAPDEAADLAEAAIELGLDVRGLMTIPPRVARPEDARRYFDDLVAIRSRLQRSSPSIVELSMGMTDDFEVAVEAGATAVRVGRAIFGPREEPAGP